MADASRDGTHAKWLREIEAYEKLARKWHEQGRKIVKRYKDDRTDNDDARKYNVLWSNVETLKPLLYSATPKPVVSRRFLDEDSIGNAVAQVLERAISFTLAEHYFGSTMRQAVIDYLLPGRGTVWARYVPHFAPDAPAAPTNADPDNSVQLTDDAGAETVGEMVAFEEAMPDYVHWTDFGHTYGRTWEEVTGVWRKVRLTRKQCVEHFPECGKDIPLDGDRVDGNDTRTPEEKTDLRATIYEIWDRTSLSVIFICKHHPETLKEVPDPLSLPQFFPCPRPLYATLANDGLIPVPDYKQYQDQARELDDLTGRIAGITRAIRVTGVYDGTVKELERVMSEGTDNRLIAIENWAALSEKGGIAGAIQLVPVQEIAQTLLSLYEARKEVKADLYEITGMSDIIRGATDPRETATAQKGKMKYAGMRLDERQREVARFGRNVVVIIGNIIARKFGQDTLAKMTGIKLFATPEAKQQAEAMAAQLEQPTAPPQPGMAPQPAPPKPKDSDPTPFGMTFGEAKEALDKPSWAEVMAMLRDEPERNFSIDIETDSTVANDQEADKQEANEFLTAMGGFLGEAAKAPPTLLPLIGELLKFAIRRYPVGRELESTLDTMLDKLIDEAGDPAPPPVDPMVELKKAELAQKGEQGAATHQLATATQADDHAFRMATLTGATDNNAATLKLKEREVVLKEHDSGANRAHAEAQNVTTAASAYIAHADKQSDRDHALKLARMTHAHNDEKDNAEREHETKTKDDDNNAAAETSNKMADALSHITKLLTAPRVIERDKDGRVTASRAKVETD